jgi:hypothetical protein
MHTRGLRLREAPDRQFSKGAVIRKWDDEDGHNGTDQHEQDRPWGMTRPFAYHCE